MYNYILTITLLILSGLFSGLTLGLMSLDPFELKRKIRLGDKHAERVYPLRKNGNLLLCNLLLGNVAVNSALAVFLGSITSGIIASILATTLIVIFGEIIPQSLFSKHALSFGAKSAFLVDILTVLLYPITKPLSLLLDWWLGGELPTHYSKRELHMILREQKDLKSDIDHLEFKILEGGLLFSDKKVIDVMTPRKKVFQIKESETLTKKLITKIHKTGHSRIPVYKETKDTIVGILYTKDLSPITPSERVKVKKVMKYRNHHINESDTLDKVLLAFKKKRTHLFLVQDQFKLVTGIITLEDVLEEIVGEIVDEHDLVVDMRLQETDSSNL
jgi:metal transporter CNNM